MKVFQIQDDWSMEHLTIAERDKPEPGRGEVLLRMKAASLNFRDLVVPMRGYGSFTGTLPLIPISDGVGEVVQVGAGVTRVAAGDRVCPMFMQNWIAGEPDMTRITSTLGAPIDGVMQEYMVLSEEGVAKVPSYLSDEEAATLPCAALTAWSALVAEGDVKAGDRVLVQGTGGVSLFALQFAKLFGALVIITSSSDEKLERAMALGADESINYITIPEWGKAVKELTRGDGVDHIVEVGGEKTLPQSLRAIRPGGTVSMIGVLSGVNMGVGLGLIVTRKIRLQGITVGHRDSFEAMTRALTQHQLKPVIDRVFAFEELKEAMEYLREGKHFGKICIRF
ncbi:Alcohol dehydrogenase (EC [Olavius algarvensis associated proteobacterium Delta 3]|nr:Alcohol dehydrogenase (EC [Olavius algarvensis associated proteobacterium Delta 3]CAB5126789.1 Alcohol dehydrogenase (EC [Olavius algarvensis associated proteobacterium Delta 3]